MEDIIIRFPVVQAATGLARTTIWRHEQLGQFPRRRRLGANSVGWVKSEVEHWIRSRPTFRSGEVALGDQV
jgi:prophage regulatory protein